MKCTKCGTESNTSFEYEDQRLCEKCAAELVSTWKADERAQKTETKGLGQP